MVGSLRALGGEQTTGWHLAIDGKTERGSYDKGSGKKAIHAVSVFLSDRNPDQSIASDG